MNTLINWSELSRFITGGDRNSLRPKKIPKKHWGKIDKLIEEDLPAWWGAYKENHKSSGVKP
jgi:hypothetical protein